VIDLHCHILPGVDDGALDVTDSLGMARQAAGDGIAAVCATPHIRHDHAVRIGELAGRVRELAAAVDAAGVPVAVLPGGEVAEPGAVGLSDEDLRSVTLGGGGRWILLEPRAGPLSDALSETIGALGARGFSCVVAHPERHPVADLAERLEEAARLGALVQATAALLEDGPAAPVLLDLAARGLVHVLASDAHSSHGGRPVRLSAAFERLRGAGVPEARVRWMAEDVPARIVRGEPV
jgi:protein-tyrosine phosphatase